VVGEEEIRDKFALLMPHLNERQRRLLAGAEARSLGRGGIAVVSRITGMSRSTVHAAIREIDEGPEVSGRIRRPGGGRKRITQKDRKLLADLDAMVDPLTRGDPESPLRWTTKSTRQLAGALQERGHPVSQHTVGELLHRLGYTLQAPRKTHEGSSHPDRDAQFRHIAKQATARLKAGQPVISVDTKKKELIGEYKNAGQEWYLKGQGPEVLVHDFPDPEVPKAVPYGVYDVGTNTGWVSVGTDHDTASFAVATIRRWWDQMGVAAYPRARRLLICADSGGSNGYRSRLWKIELARFASEAGMGITVCHLPPGTSKWNKIEHRLFCHISMNWRGRPLTSYEVVVELIVATTTATGLKVHAELDTNAYPKGVKITDEELAALPIRPHRFHGEWNYTFVPAAPE
jgi:transposase